MAGFQLHNIAHSEWKVPTRYENLMSIGHGAYGSVCSAYDTKLHRRVAIKKLSRAFESEIDAKRTYRELKITHHVDHENIVCLIDVFTPQLSRQDFKDVYLVGPLMDMDLEKCMQSTEIPVGVIQEIIYQILLGLKYLHSSGITHRDIKPSNIAINEDKELKIIDFGLARQVDEKMTGYVVTRWYRAPEVLFNWEHYTDKVDIWSVGCIMAELFTRFAIFRGHNHLDQLKKISEIAGTPDEEFMSKISNDARNYMSGNIPVYPRKDFRTFFQESIKDENAIDLIDKMLILDPDRRISATDALAHPFFADYHNEDDECVGSPFIYSMEDKSDMNLESWKDVVWDFIQNFSPNITNLKPTD